eukprot:2232802-Rhodomonas_salina.1
MFSNEIGDAGASALGGALQGCSTLSTLQLQNNLIGDVGFVALARGVLAGTVESLDLCSNPVGGAGIQKFAEEVARDPGGRCLRLCQARVMSGAEKVSQGERVGGRSTLTQRR